MVAQQPPPAPRHRQRLEERREQAEIADPELELLEPRLTQRLDDERQHRRIVALAICRGEGLDAGLAELPGVGAVGAAGLIAEGRAAVAVACRHGAAGMARQVQPAGRHGQIRPQAQLLAVGVGEHVGARPQGLAHHVEEQTRRLNDAGRHLLIARASEGGQQPLRLLLQGLELLCSLGHGSARRAARSPSPWRAQDANATDLARRCTTVSSSANRRLSPMASYGGGDVASARHPARRNESTYRHGCNS